METGACGVSGACAAGRVAPECDSDSENATTPRKSSRRASLLFACSTSDNPCCESAGKKWTAELCRGQERFLGHKQWGPGQNPGETQWKWLGVLPLEVAHRNYSDINTVELKTYSLAEKMILCFLCQHCSEWGGVALNYRPSCPKDQLCRECWLRAWEATERLTEAVVSYSCVTKAPQDIRHIGMCCIEKESFPTHKVQWVLFSSCTVTANKSILSAWTWCRSDSGWNVSDVISHVPSFIPQVNWGTSGNVFFLQQAWTGYLGGHLTDQPICVCCNFQDEWACSQSWEQPSKLCISNFINILRFSLQKKHRKLLFLNRGWISG